MVQFHCNKRPETAKPLTFFNRFPVRSETPIYSGSSSEKMAVCFTVISNIAALTRVPINKKRAHLLSAGTKIVEIRNPLSNYKLYSFIETIYQTISELNVNCFLGANKNAVLLTYKLSRYSLMQKSIKLTG